MDNGKSPANIARRSLAIFLFSIFNFQFSILFLLPPHASGEDFRVDNEVRLGERGAGVKSTTFFLGDDFLGLIGENGEITFFESAKETFVLLDPRLRIQTRIVVSETKNPVDLWRRKNETNPDPFVAFVAKPVFQREFDAASGSLSLQSPWFHYRLETEPWPDEETAKRYFDFCDLTCYLNFRLAQGKVPTPLVRLEVNRLLRDGKRFPKSMTVSYFPKGNTGLLPKEEKSSSTHKLVRRLDEADKAQVARARDAMRTYPIVSFEEYQKKVLEKKP